MASFPRVTPLELCAHLSPPPCAPHAPPTSFFSILPSAQYWAGSSLSSIKLMIHEDKGKCKKTMKFSSTPNYHTKQHNNNTSTCADSTSSSTDSLSTEGHSVQYFKILNFECSNYSSTHHVTSCKNGNTDYRLRSCDSNI